MIFEQLLHTGVGAEINDFVSLNSFLRLVLPESVVCSLTFKVQKSASLFGFVLCVVLVLTFVGVGKSIIHFSFYFGLLYCRSLLYA